MHPPAIPIVLSDNAIAPAECGINQKILSPEPMWKNPQRLLKLHLFL
ncbi:MAG: hypothetical protein HC773_11975 [Scytonema sp. CRU_2_7]|nr:hypothetical protein [Scytonema sp. CRU_2_7]